ncbi:ARM repeat-containing protein [Sistotremastrum niveocremeum HHB9708]|uniref:Importin-13 n=1 Tax=Sistotremastrum niveocremeum HHB9708 TaxID=1314777 RepID=A0A164MXU9_9AGAM|nr:ARM repeat-containing protein [Sistotremastrum niveocremeum HHB9708]
MSSYPTTNILPVLAQSDIFQAASLIQQAYSPTPHSAQSIQSIQADLLNIQKRPEAWGLVEPFLEWDDGNVQFFGAHTVQVKIARDWDEFPEDRRGALKDLLLGLTSRAISARRNKIIIRKLFIALTTLALKLAPTNPSGWPDWIRDAVSSLERGGAEPSSILEFLSIVAEEITTADLLPGPKARMEQSLIDFTPTLARAVRNSLTLPSVPSHELISALQCLESWIGWGLPANDLTPLIPLLISLLDSGPGTDPHSGSILNSGSEGAFEGVFEAASRVLGEVLGRSTLSDGGGVRILTVPLLEWIHRRGMGIFNDGIECTIIAPTSHALLLLLTALADHSTSYISTHLLSPPVQTFLRLMLAYMGLEGYYGVDEEESEMCLGFWYLLQEGIWGADFVRGRFGDSEGNVDDEGGGDAKEQWKIATELYMHLIKILKRKVQWPPREELRGWMKDQRDKFNVYRRDVGDTLINAYYILRDDLLQYYVDCLIAELAARREGDPWEGVEATLHCISSVQESVPLTPNPHLERLFSSEVLGRLPGGDGREAVRKTAVGMIGAYATWFTLQPTPLLMTVLSYVVSALTSSSTPTPSSASSPNINAPARQPTSVEQDLLILSAANALRDLCDANRGVLARSGAIAGFGELYSQIGGIPDTEKAKVIESIASVVQALPVEEQIGPLEAIVSPVVGRIWEALRDTSQLPLDARALLICQLEALTGCARGLTQGSENTWILDEPSPQEAEELERARGDERMRRVREGLVGVVEGVLGVWGGDAGVGDSLSDLLKAITSLPSDTTLLTLPAPPLLILISSILSTPTPTPPSAIYISLLSRLILQLNPPDFGTLKGGGSEENLGVLVRVLPGVLEGVLGFLGGVGVMDDNPDVVRALLECLEMVALHFVKALFLIPRVALDAVMRFAGAAMGMQERYSLVAACLFLNSLINQVLGNSDLEAEAEILTEGYGKSIMRAVIYDIAGVAPRSALQNVVEVLTNLMSKRRERGRVWMQEILFEEDAIPGKANREAKEQFLKAVTASRSSKKTRDAAQQFSIIARGLENSSFGYATLA